MVLVPPPAKSNRTLTSTLLGKLVWGNLFSGTSVGSGLMSDSSGGRGGGGGRGKSSLAQICRCNISEAKSVRLYNFEIGLY